MRFIVNIIVISVRRVIPSIHLPQPGSVPLCSHLRITAQRPQPSADRPPLARYSDAYVWRRRAQIERHLASGDEGQRTSIKRCERDLAPRQISLISFRRHDTARVSSTPRRAVAAPAPARPPLRRDHVTTERHPSRRQILTGATLATRLAVAQSPAAKSARAPGRRASPSSDLRRARPSRPIRRHFTPPPADNPLSHGQISTGKITHGKRTGMLVGRHFFSTFTCRQCSDSYFKK